MVLTRAYGASLWHLPLVLVAFGTAAYVVAELLPNPSAGRMLVWFAGAVLLHDLVLFPVYAGADRVLTGLVSRARRWAPAPVNYVRTPVLGTALLFLLFFPGIVRQGSFTYTAATGQTQEPFLLRWLLLSAAMFVVAAIVYTLVTVLRAVRAGRRRGHRPQSTDR